MNPTNWQRSYGRHCNFCSSWKVKYYLTLILGRKPQLIFRKHNRKRKNLCGTHNKSTGKVKWANNWSFSPFSWGLNGNLGTKRWHSHTLNMKIIKAPLICTKISQFRQISEVTGLKIEMVPYLQWFVFDFFFFLPYHGEKVICTQ